MQTIDNIINLHANNDCCAILAGSKAPYRDAISLRRVFTSGEVETIRPLIPQIKEHKSGIDEAEKQVQIEDANSKVLIDKFTEDTNAYEEANQADKDELTKLKQRREQEEKKLHALTTNPDGGQDNDGKQNKPIPPQKRSNSNLKRFAGFMLVAFVAELVAFIATISLQRENLSMSAIYTRIGFIAVIYVYTGILYHRYTKSRLASVKALLIGCIMMSLVSLLHVVAVSYLNLDATTSDTMEFSLSALEEVETHDTPSIITSILYSPGLIEFIISTILVFAGETLTIDDKKKAPTQAPETTTPLQNTLKPIDFTQALIESIRRHIEKIDMEIAQLKKRMEQRNAEFDIYTAEFTTQLQECQKKKAAAEKALTIHQEQLDHIIDQAYYMLESYRTLVVSELAFNLGVAPDTITYEPATKDDIKNYCSLQ